VEERRFSAALAVQTSMGFSPVVGFIRVAGLLAAGKWGQFVPVLRRSADRSSRCRGHTRRRAPQRNQGDTVLPVIYQRPLRGAIIAQPIVLHQSLLLPGAHKRRRGGFSRFGHAVGLDQEKFAISEPKKGLATFRIGAPAKHVFTTSCSAKNSLGEPLDSQ
jgi:hypothetical protein